MGDSVIMLVIYVSRIPACEPNSDSPVGVNWYGPGTAAATVQGVKLHHGPAVNPGRYGLRDTDVAWKELSAPRTECFMERNHTMGQRWTK